MLTDVERLCNRHIPRWLASPGMAADKIAAYYRDPVRAECERASSEKAYYLRSLSTGTGLSWRARRLSRLVGRAGIGALRRAQRRLTARPQPKSHAAQAL